VTNRSVACHQRPRRRTGGPTAAEAPTPGPRRSCRFRPGWPSIRTGRRSKHRPKHL